MKTTKLPEEDMKDILASIQQELNKPFWHPITETPPYQERLLIKRKINNFDYPTQYYIAEIWEDGYLYYDDGGVEIYTNREDIALYWAYIPE